MEESQELSEQIADIYIDIGTGIQLLSKGVELLDKATELLKEITIENAIPPTTAANVANDQD